MRYLLLPLFISTCFIASAQSLTDTSELEEVVVKAYFSEQPLLRAPSSIGVINTQILQNQPGYSLLPAVNTVPGVRMEERSPGSYRLSIRGSLLRSPFGIRNVKMYLDDFLLTDAGGNTYLNLLDAANVGRIEILKGPEGSIFGANSGGVVLIDSKQLNSDSSAFSGSITAGSYQLLQQNLTAETRKDNFQVTLNQSFQRSDGYRQNSSMNRKSIQIMPKWNYSKSAQLNFIIMYSDLQYQTPGGLTSVLLQEDPRLARPGAEEQQAAIYNKTLFTGISHTKLFNTRLRHVISLTGSFTDFVNPFITTYETRKEKNLGIRTYLELLSKRSIVEKWSWQYGVEAQQMNSQKKNYENIKGQSVDKQDFVDFDASHSFLFTRFSWQANTRLSIETALSLNFYKYNFKGIYPIAVSEETRGFKAQLMPRAAVSYMLTDYLALRASLSRGYSPPTIEEVRPSNRVINTELEPESGWNYESGLRLSLLSNRLFLDGVIFNYNLRNAIVRRVDASDSEYFVNAGGTNQTGLEFQLNAWVLPLKNTGFVRGVKIAEAYTYSNFKFSEYSIDTKNFSGNRLTGVPRHNVLSSAELRLPARVNLYIQHNYVSSIPLNDANAFYADKYHLLQAKFSWQKQLKQASLKVFAGADNLLNTNYSLGNDLNAFGSRFFNPSPPRNYYGGLSVQF